MIKNSKIIQMVTVVVMAVIFTSCGMSSYTGSNTRVVERRVVVVPERHVYDYRYRRAPHVYRRPPVVIYKDNRKQPPRKAVPVRPPNRRDNGKKYAPAPGNNNRRPERVYRPGRN